MPCCRIPRRRSGDNSQLRFWMCRCPCRSLHIAPANAVQRRRARRRAGVRCLRLFPKRKSRLRRTNPIIERRRGTAPPRRTEPTCMAGNCITFVFTFCFSFSGIVMPPIPYGSRSPSVATRFSGEAVSDPGGCSSLEAPILRAALHIVVTHGANAIKPKTKTRSAAPYRIFPCRRTNSCTQTHGYLR